MMTLALLALAFFALAAIAAGFWHVGQGGFLGTMIGLNAIQAGFDLLGSVAAATLEAVAGSNN